MLQSSDSERMSVRPTSRLRPPIRTLVVVRWCWFSEPCQYVPPPGSATGASRCLERRGGDATSPGARTGIFVPALDRLFVASPARDGRPAEILIFRID